MRSLLGKKLGRKTVAIIAGAAIVVAGAGVAVAYWTNTGSGGGSATTGSNSPITVNQTSTVTAMGPGVAAQSLSGNFDNPNDGPVYVAAVTATVTGTDKTGCTASDYTIAGTSTPAVQVPVGEDVGAWTGLTIAFNNKVATNQDACKGAVVTIAYVSS
jgi:hypothetical protein